MADFKVKLTGDWWVASLLEKHARTFGSAEFDKVAKAIAEKYKKAVLETIKTEGRSAKATWSPLAPSTLATKRSRKILNDRGALRKGLKIWKQDGGYFVGYRPGVAYNSNGVDIAVVASTHEEGRTIRILVTKEMVAAYMAKLNHYKKRVKDSIGRGKMKVGSVMTIVIPKRSFLESTYNASFKGYTVDQLAMETLKEVSPLIRGLFKNIKV